MLRHSALAILFCLLAMRADGSPPDALWTLYRAKDFFSLRERLPPEEKREAIRVRLIRAETEAAFGEYSRSSARLRALISSSPSEPQILHLARERLMLNERAAFRYRAALAAIEPLMRSRPDAELQNRAVLLRALANVGPERLQTASGATTAILHVDHLGRIPVAINGRRLWMTIDTGANLSAISRSAALVAGLSIAPIAYSVRGAAGKRMSGELAIANLSFGSRTHVLNAVLLVLPDGNLRLSRTANLDGLIGLPVLSQLGPIRFEKRGRIAIGRTVRMTGSTTQLALIDSDPVMRAGSAAGALLCRLDTGANKSVFYSRFLSRLGVDRFISRRIHAVSVKTAGGGGRMQFIRLKPFDLKISGRTVRVTEPLYLPEATAGERTLDCNIGRDLLHRLGSYTIDLQRLRFAVN